MFPELIVSLFAPLHHCPNRSLLMKQCFGRTDAPAQRDKLNMRSLMNPPNEGFVFPEIRDSPGQIGGISRQGRCRGIPGKADEHGSTFPSRCTLIALQHHRVSKPMPQEASGSTSPRP